MEKHFDGRQPQSFNESLTKKGRLPSAGAYKALLCVSYVYTKITFH